MGKRRMLCAVMFFFILVTVVLGSACAAHTTQDQPVPASRQQFSTEREEVRQPQPQQSQPVRSSQPPQISTAQNRVGGGGGATPPASVQNKPKIAVYITGGKTVNENQALNARITHALVNSGRYSMIERADVFLDQVAREMVTQRSGAIDDRQISELGRQAGASFVCVGEILEVFGAHQISARIINVESVEVIASGVASGSLKNIDDFERLSNSVVASLLGLAQSPVTASGHLNTAVQPATQPAVVQPTAQPTTRPAAAAPAIKGIDVPGGSLTEKLAWLQRSADSHNTYILEAKADENIAPHTFQFQGAINITVVLRGDGENRTIRLRSNGTMFEVRANVTFILDHNITLHGHSQNSSCVVWVNGGIFIMNNGSTITGNTYSSDGSGVYVGGGTFTMNDGTISNNTVRGSGGGVFNGSNFTMRGGIITGNTASRHGGGVLSWGTFTKGGGTITGHASDPANGNVVRDAAGNVIARQGHAVFINENRRKETTAGPGVNLSHDSTGGWDN